MIMPGVAWYSQKQNTIKSLFFGAAFVVMKSGMENTQRMIGVHIRIWANIQIF